MSVQQISDKMLVEMLILSSSFPIDEDAISEKLGYKPFLQDIISVLNDDYHDRGILISEVLPGKWAVRTKSEYSNLCRDFLRKPMKISKAGYETLSVIAYFQPVTRSEIERVRGVSLSPGTIEALIFSGLVRLGPRRATPGNPMTFMTTDQFLLAFNFKSLDELPERDEMKAQGLLSAERGISTSGLPSTSSDD